MELQFSSIIDDYQKYGVLGNGTFGEVGKYYCLTNNTFCAIKKIIKQRRGAPPINLAKVSNEIRIHSKLHHHNIVRLYEWFSSSEYVYMIIELCSYGSLHQLIERANQTSVCVSKNEDLSDASSASALEHSIVKSIVKQLAQGIRYCHHNNIFHRDLNLHNVLISSLSDGYISVKITDFGEALDGCQVVNRNYVSAEDNVQENLHFFPASDLFALGCIIYSLVTGNTFNDQLDTSSLNPIAADLVQRLTSFDLERRIPIVKVLKHPFVCEIPFERLPVTNYATESFEFHLNHQGITVIFKGSGNELCVDRSKVSISSHEMSNSWNLLDLPQHFWKEYSCAWDFLSFVASKTPKMTYRTFAPKPFSSDPSLVEVVLMESGDIEFNWNDYNVKCDVYVTELSAELRRLCNEICSAEENLERSGTNECFPANFSDGFQASNSS